MMFRRGEFMNLKIFDKPFLKSRIRSANVETSEKWLGYFLGPAVVYCMFTMCGQTYLNQFYTDVLHMTRIQGGVFLALLPILSKILDAITNVIMGRVVDNTHSSQGKARPWILISGIFLTISGILLFTVPKASDTVQAVYVTITYNLYFCFAFTMYNISHTLMVPLSTRNSSQRDVLGMFTSMGTSMVPGVVVSMLFPLLILPSIGVSQHKWIQVMSVISILALPAVMLEYYFTRERVTEETGEEQKKETIPFRDQIRGCFQSSCWVLIMAVVLVYNLYNNFQVTSLLYYVKWVLSTPAKYQSVYALVNAVGQAPLGLGVFLMWPLVRKLGKIRCAVIGSVFSILGNILCALNPGNLTVVLCGLAIRSFGALPITYTLIAMIADALDHVEWVNGFRCDGFSSSFYSILLTVCVGISTGLFNLGLGRSGYDSTLAMQNASSRSFLTFGTFLVPAIGAAIIMVLFLFDPADRKSAQVHADLTARRKAECEKAGIPYVSPEEKAEQERKEQDAAAEKKRVEELKAKCVRKGLNFEEEEAKYLERKNRKRGRRK